MRQEVGRRKTISATIYFCQEAEETFLASSFLRLNDLQTEGKCSSAGLSPQLRPRRNAVLIDEVVNGQGRPFSLPLGASHRKCWYALFHHHFTSVVCYSSTTCCNSTLWTIQMIYSKCNTADSQHSDLSFQLNADSFPKQTHEQGKTFFLHCSANTLRQMSAGVAAWAERVIPVSVSSSHFLTRS